ncbi:P2 family phage major capsid protein [Neisseria meningitidis]|uniref:P2 family phage major capsid protein n=1 Tax=Neisseria meningitidis TaxID=487 RepID=UPI00403C6E2E
MPSSRSRQQGKRAAPRRHHHVGETLGRPAVVTAPYFPKNTILVTPLKNLSIYFHKADTAASWRTSRNSTASPTTKAKTSATSWKSTARRLWLKTSKSQNKANAV